MTSPQVERRLTAILAADVVGYSRLVEAHEAETLAALVSLRQSVLQPLLAEHRGRLVKLMGDGLIAEFASVVGAVACAAAIQRTKITSSRKASAAIAPREGERSTSKASDHETSSPCSRRRLNS